MSSNINASLVLRTGDLTAGSQTNVGICDTNLLSFTWSNINMRTLLGTMYDQYDTFNLCLSSITTSLATAGIGSTASDRTLVINVGGLPFINNTYDTGLKHNVTTTVLGTFTFVPSNTASNFFYSSNVASFAKNTDVVNISINYSRVSLFNGSYNVVTLNPFPDVVFIFDIFGIPKDTPSHNGERLKLQSYHP